jgi:hypothetical protein
MSVIERTAWYNKFYIPQCVETSFCVRYLAGSLCQTRGTVVTKHFKQKRHILVVSMFGSSAYTKEQFFAVLRLMCMNWLRK